MRKLKARLLGLIRPESHPATSGAMYAMVPARVLGLVMLQCLERPKSVILIVSRRGLRVRRTRHSA